MTSARSIINRAAAEVGKGERPPGSNLTRYGQWYGMDGQPWCAMFQSWVFSQEGMPEIRFAYTPSFAQFFVDQGRWHDDSPQRGDLVFFNFPDSLDRIQHVGLVTETHPDGSITTIEGNTSSGEGGSQDNGEGVFRRVRKSFIVGYGSPSYNSKPQRQQKPLVKLWFGKGDKGADVRRWQIQLQKIVDPDPALLVDGEFGRNTLAATLLFQEKFQQDVDGRVGAASLRAMEEAIKALRGG